MEVAGIEVEGIEGQALGPEPVVAFVEMVYGALVQADAAPEFVSTARHVLQELVDSGVTKAQQTQFSKAVDRADRLSGEIRELSCRASELVPLAMQAAAFDDDLQRWEAQWNTGVRLALRVNYLWSRMVSATVPMARTAAGRVMYLLAVASSEGRPGAEAVPMDMLDPAASLLASHPGCLERTDRISTRTPRDMLDGVMGALIHLAADTPSTMTLFPTSRPERWVRLTLGTGSRMQLECVGDHALPPGSKLAEADKQHLRDLGLVPPGRKRAERNWRIVSEEFEPFGTTTAAASILVNVHHLQQGESLTVITASSDTDVPRSEPDPERPRRVPRGRS